MYSYPSPQIDHICSHNSPKFPFSQNNCQVSNCELATNLEDSKFNYFQRRNETVDTRFEHLLKQKLRAKRRELDRSMINTGYRCDTLKQILVLDQCTRASSDTSNIDASRMPATSRMPAIPFINQSGFMETKRLSCNGKNCPTIADTWKMKFLLQDLLDEAEKNNYSKKWFDSLKDEENMKRLLMSLLKRDKSRMWDKQWVEKFMKSIYGSVSDVFQRIQEMTSKEPDTALLKLISNLYNEIAAAQPQRGSENEERTSIDKKARKSIDQLYYDTTVNRPSAFWKMLRRRSSNLARKSSSNLHRTRRRSHNAKQDRDSELAVYFHQPFATQKRYTWDGEPLARPFLE